MIHMIRVLARVPPGDVHLAGGQVHDHCVNDTLTIHRVDALDVVIADRVGQVDMIFLNCL